MPRFPTRSMPPAARRPTALKAVLTAVAVVTLLPAPAGAHPFGPPPTAMVSVQGHSVFVEWRSAADDAMAIGETLGLLPQGTALAFQEAAVQVAPSAVDEAALDRSPELAGYLLDRVRVYQDGDRCEASLRPISDFVNAGATVVHRCPEPVRAVELKITMLHDLHEAYRTFAITREEHAQPAQWAYTRSQPRATWDFAAAPSSTSPLTTGGLWPLAVIALLGAGVAWWLLRGRQRGQSR